MGDGKIMKNIEFLKTVAKDYRIGAITISSRFTVEAVVKNIKRDAGLVVEYGAGEGKVTKKILEKLSPEGKLAAVEINENLLAHLRKIKDERLSIIEGDVVLLSEDFGHFGFSEADVAVSGVPLSFFKPKTREKIISNTAKNLSPEGRFIVYQYSPLVLPLLKKYFHQVKVEYVVRNLPPYFVMTAEK